MGTGWGEFATSSLAIQTLGFKAAIALAGVTDLVSFYNEEDCMRRARVASWQEPSALFPSTASTID
jgi:hypothetical protein